jgi:hypothetical protein
MQAIAGKHARSRDMRATAWQAVQRRRPWQHIPGRISPAAIEPSFPRERGSSASDEHLPWAPPFATRWRRNPLETCFRSDILFPRPLFTDHKNTVGNRATL